MYVNFEFFVCIMQCNTVCFFNQAGEKREKGRFYNSFKAKLEKRPVLHSKKQKEESID